MHAPLAHIVETHAGEAASLYGTRMAQLQLPHVNLQALARLDQRIVAHLDGLAVAGAEADRALAGELGEPSIGAGFASAVRAMAGREPESFRGVWVLATKNVHVLQGVISAFGWMDGRYLQGTVRDLLKSTDPTSRLAGLSACAMHRIDPGLETGPWLRDPVALIRMRALRAVGEVGLAALAPRCVAAIDDESADCRFWAAWAAVLLGSRAKAMDVLRATALDVQSPHQSRAFRLLLQATDVDAAHVMLKSVSRDPAQLWWLIQGSGIAGDPSYAGWLIGHMEAPETARAAGEAFTLVTGADLDALQLWRDRPVDFESGPTDDPADENVGLDPDEGLMWPDQQKVHRWWDANSGRFQPRTRYFMGAPVTREHCIDVLKNGYQRQRILAAHYLCLLDPGTPLFNTSAPAWRQQRLLAKLA